MDVEMWDRLKVLIIKSFHTIHLLNNQYAASHSLQIGYIVLTLFRRGVQPFWDLTIQLLL